MPSVEEEFKKQVDEMITVELENIKILSGVKQKKKKKKAKKKKSKKKKTPNIPGYKVIVGFPKAQLLSELIQNKIVKRLPE